MYNHKIKYEFKSFENGEKFTLFFDFGECLDPAEARNNHLTNSSTPNIIENYANCLLLQKDYDNAVRLYMQIAAVEPQKQFTAYFKSGTCKLLENRIAESIGHYQRALDLNKNYPLLHIVMGVSYYLLGLKARANTHWWTAHTNVTDEFIMKLIKNFFLDKFHPERLALYPICQGKGIDVGCGNRKTHPDAIGVDLLPGGTTGQHGCMNGKISQADIVASGDDLSMFKNDELDYVVQRHNLEHYEDPVRAIQEWKRVIKPGGIIGMVVPDDEDCDTMQLDPTHKHAFTPSSLNRLLEQIGGFEVIHLEKLLANWSFICVCQKTEGLQYSQFNRYDYAAHVRHFEQRQVINQAVSYFEYGKAEQAQQCIDFLNGMD